MSRIGHLVPAILILIASYSLAHAGTVVATDVPDIDVSPQMEWCDSPPDIGPVAVTAGSCRFLPVATHPLKSGFSEKAIWLRLTLANPTNHRIERWLQIGHPRITHVSFFEWTGNGWFRTETGMAVPIAERNPETLDPILALSLEPHEQHTVLVRVYSTAVIDIHAALWQPTDYLLDHQHRDFRSALGIGALLATAMVILTVYLLWNARTYLYLFGFTFSLLALTVAHSGLLQLYFWPSHWPFDLRVQIVAAAVWIVSFVLFVNEYVGHQRYRRFQRALLIMTGAALVAAIWACFFDYTNGLLATIALILITAAACCVLLWRAWRFGFTAVGFFLTLLSGYIFFRVINISLNLAHTLSANIVPTSYDLQFLFTCLPAALAGLIFHKQRMQKQLASSQAESAARVNFLAKMSHELRTPLDIIIGTAQLLSRPGHRARLQEGLADISSNGRQLLKMIDEVLDYSRGVAGKLSLKTEPVIWQDFLHNLKNDAMMLAAANGNTVTLTVDGDALWTACVDAPRLKQVLDNLVANASRHTQKGMINLRCNVGIEQEDRKRLIEFAVNDTGEGIPPEDMERIFEPFERGGNSVRNGGKGVGMGLAISRQLVQLMGGQLTAESTPGKSTTFRFTCFAQSAPTSCAKTLQLKMISGYAGRRRTILIVDDQAKNRAILADLLREIGFRVIEASSGREALPRISDVDLVFTDQFMADGDGWFMLQELAKRRPDLPVVLISAALPNRPDDLPPDLDFAASLLKPLNHTDVLNCVGNLLVLQWIESPNETTAPIAVPNDDRPPDAKLEELRSLIEAGRVSEIIAWAAALTEDHQRYKCFADRIQAAAHDLDFDTLNELTE